MQNKWQPKNAPAVKQDFSRAGARPSPVGKPEMDRLKSQRDQPQQLELKLNAPTPPGGSTAGEQIQKQQQSKEREARIEYIRERLGRQQSRAQGGFQKANVVPKPDPVSKQEVVQQKQEINRREARIQYIQQRLAAKRDRARGSFDRAR